LAGELCGLSCDAAGHFAEVRLMNHLEAKGIFKFISRRFFLQPPDLLKMIRLVFRNFDIILR
jgi:hypothetical protein